ncbi:hypothetical protein [Streptomyces sp. Inha503]
MVDDTALSDRAQRGREEAHVIAEAVKTADAAMAIDSFLRH